jgi:ParB-like chromosome segregation protein Spo0J
MAAKAPERNLERLPKPIHPLAELFPLIEGEELTSLIRSIQRDGLQEPIALFNGAILDGRNRAHACEEGGVEPWYVDLPPDTDPLTYVLNKNLHRRHLSESQRGMLAAKLETLRHGDNQHTAGDANLHVHREDAARMLNVSVRTVASAAKVRDHGAPELQQAVERGEVSVAAAAEIANRLPEQQVERVKELADKPKRRSSAAVAHGERSPCFVCKYADGQVTRMTSAFDLGRAFRVSQDVYWERSGLPPPDAVEAHFERDGVTLKEYSAEDLKAFRLSPEGITRGLEVVRYNADLGANTPPSSRRRPPQRRPSPSR